MSDYLVKNDLIDYADIPEKQKRRSSKPKVDEDKDVEYGYGRSGWIRASLPDEVTVDSWSSGGYQGKQAFIISLDGYLWLIDTYYGSCSYCDRFIENEKSETENLIRSARCFETKDDLLAWVDEADDEYVFKRGYTDSISKEKIEGMIDEVTENEDE